MAFSSASRLCRRFSPQLISQQFINGQQMKQQTTINRIAAPLTNFLQPSRSFASKKETITIHLTMPDGNRVTTKGKVGDSILDAIIENDIDIDGYGACEGTLACSTCHMIFTKDQFLSLPEKATDEELDMLDLAFELTDTSRLGCQIILSKEMDGWEIKVPAGIADARDV